MSWTWLTSDAAWAVTQSPNLHKDKGAASSSVAARADTSKRETPSAIKSGFRTASEAVSRGAAGDDGAEVQELRQQVSTIKSDLEWSQETIKDLESALEAKEEELAKAQEVSCTCMHPDINISTRDILACSRKYALCRCAYAAHTLDMGTPNNMRTQICGKHLFRCQGL
jgi:hypothetical protein